MKHLRFAVLCCLLVAASLALFACGGGGGSDVTYRGGRSSYCYGLSEYMVEVRSDGTLWAWGRNTSGQLGNGTVNSSASPVRVGTDTDWRSAFTGENHTVAIKTDGTLWAWGDGMWGQLGTGTWAWDVTTPVQVGSDTDWAQVSAGARHTLALKSDGTLWAWGDNLSGQLGIGPAIEQLSPVQVGSDSGWEQVAAGGYHSLALKADGSLWAWGYNGSGVVGDGTTESRFTPVRVGADADWVSVSAGEKSTLALKADGTLWAWGDNLSGQLGTGTWFVSSSVPVQVGTDADWALVAAGYSHTLALKADGTLWAWGDPSSGQLGLGVPRWGMLSPAQVGTDADWTWIAACWMHSAARKADGSLWTWGSNTHGQLGNGSRGTKGSPVQIGADADWSDVAAASDHTLAIKTDGTLWAWGNNANGELGDGSTWTEIHVPTRIGADMDWAQVMAASGHTLALKTDGTLWAWGNNHDGGFGDGTETHSAVPVMVSASKPWIRIEANATGSMGLLADGTLWAWGGAVNSKVPVQIGSGKLWADVAVSYSRILAVRDDGTLWGWEFSIPTSFVDRDNPVMISNAPVWASVDQGFWHKIAVRMDGTLWGWGNYGYPGATTDGLSPVQVGSDTDWVRGVDGFYDVSFGLKSDGTLWGWGNNYYGQIGDGTFKNQSSPVQVGAGSLWADIAAGESHSIAIKSDGTLWGWGSNNYGQIGDGSGPTLVPTKVY